jgi:hypothetical protein
MRGSLVKGSHIRSLVKGVTWREQVRERRRWREKERRREGGGERERKRGREEERGGGIEREREREAQPARGPEGVRGSVAHASGLGAFPPTGRQY